MSSRPRVMVIVHRSACNSAAARCVSLSLLISIVPKPLSKDRKPFASRGREGHCCSRGKILVKPRKKRATDKSRKDKLITVASRTFTGSTTVGKNGRCCRDCKKGVP